MLKQANQANEKEEHSMYEKLFAPIKIRGMELKSRIVLPAMGTKFSGKTSFVTDQLIDYHVARVKGGSTLNIV